MKEITKRLRGIYEIPVNDGAGPLDGKYTFTRIFDNMPPICIQAADRIDALEECLREFMRHEPWPLPKPPHERAEYECSHIAATFAKARALLEDK